MGKRGAAAGLILALGLAGSQAAAAACAPDTLEFRTAAGSTGRFTVELARTSEERARGLMFRETMPRSSGMLFVYDAPQRAAFWMKNTLIPLDMVFIDPTGTVTRLHEMAKPQDTTLIDGGEGVQYVLEINGGLGAPLGLEPGTVVRHPAIDPDQAAWPCPAE